MPMLAQLPNRGVVSVAGADRVGFLNGLVSNDVAKAAPGRAVWAALLTPQGRYLADFFVFADGDRLLLDAPRALVPELVKRLNRFRLRAAVSVQDVSDRLRVYAAWDDTIAPALGAPDPRLAEAGHRFIAAIAPATASANEYDALRLGLGLPDGPPDLEPDKTLLLEAGFDELHGVDWQKGCYMGQELTARTKYRGLVKKRLFPVHVMGPAAPPGTPISSGGKEVGALRSSSGGLALAMLRLDAVQDMLTIGTAIIKPHVPSWMALPA